MNSDSAVSVSVPTCECCFIRQQYFDTVRVHVCLAEHEIPSIVLVKGEDIPDPKKRKNRAYRGKKQNFNGGRPLKSSTTKQAESVPPVAETEEAAAPDTATLPSAQ